MERNEKFKNPKILENDNYDQPTLTDSENDLVVLKKQISSLSELSYKNMLNKLEKFFKTKKTPITKTRLLNNIKGILFEESGNRSKQYQSEILNLNIFQRQLDNISIEQIKSFRQSPEDLYETIKSSIKKVSTSSVKNVDYLRPTEPLKMIPESTKEDENYISFFEPFNFDLEYTTNSEKPQNFNWNDTKFKITSFVHSDPYKLALLNIDEQISDEQIKIMIQNFRPDIEVEKVEFFHTLNNKNHIKNAFISLSSAEDYDYLARNIDTRDGIRIGSKTSHIVDIDEINNLVLQTDPPMNENQLENFLNKLKISELIKSKQILPTISKNFDYKKKKFTYRILKKNHNQLTGISFLQFPNHSIAYSAYYSLFRSLPKHIHVSWKTNEQYYFQETVKARDDLSLQNAQLYVNLKNLSKDNPKDEVSLNHVIFERVSSALQLYDGELEKTANLLQISPKKLQKLLKDLKLEGYFSED